MLHFLESVNLFSQKLCLSQINIPINRAALGRGKWFWLHSWSRCWWTEAHTTGVSSLFWPPPPPPPPPPPKALITIITLWVLIYCCELSLSLFFAFPPSFKLFRTFPCSGPPIRSSGNWSSGRVGGLVISCTPFDSSGPPPRVSGERAVALFSPSEGAASRRPSWPTVHLSLLTPRRIPGLSFIFNIIPGVCLESIPLSPKVCRIEIQERTGAERSQMSQIHPLRVCGCQHDFQWRNRGFRGLSEGLVQLLGEEIFPIRKL